MQSFKLNRALKSGREFKVPEKEEDIIRKSPYHSPRWKAVRKAFLELNPCCVMCGKKANTVDHKKRWGADGVDFWDQSNYQPMCFPCHQRKRGQESHKPRKDG